MNKSFVTVFCSLMCCHNTPLHFFTTVLAMVRTPAWFAGNSPGPVFVTSHRVISPRKWVCRLQRRYCWVGRITFA